MICSVISSAFKHRHAVLQQGGQRARKLAEEMHPHHLAEDGHADLPPVNGRLALLAGAKTAEDETATTISPTPATTNA